MVANPIGSPGKYSFDARVSSRPRQFARYPWFPEHGAELIDQDDLARFEKIKPAGRVFGYSHCDGWIILDDGAFKFRVQEKLLVPVPAPRFWVGDFVEFQSSGVNQLAVVSEILWHFKLEAPYYLLSKDGKRLSKRYFEQDLNA
jgi:hypothetical protein